MNNCRIIIFALIALALCAASCHNDRDINRLLDTADSLLYAGAADSAMTLLDSTEAQLPSFSRSTQMRFRLLQADAMNKTYRDFTTDSIMLEVAHYYDRHGTPNERLRAHYLLGCTYRDMKEAPLALITWEDAVAHADTLSPDCDFATLYRIYGQMAGIYFRQYLFEQQLEAQNKYCKYAIAAYDTVAYLKGLIKRNDAYLQLEDMAAIQRNVKEVMDECNRCGKNYIAVQAYPTLIDMSINASDYVRAGKMMKEFEQESGLFDEHGNIYPSGERYYYNKGRYYLAMEQMDSAEIQFRKLLPFKRFNRDACQGLMYLFSNTKQYDSMLYYSRLYELALVEYNENTKVDAIVQVTGMYDYHRQQRIAAVEQYKSHWFKLVLVLTSVLFCLCLLISIRFYILKKERHKKIIQQMMAESVETRHELNEAKDELEILRANLESNTKTELLLSSKENEVHKLEVSLKEYEKIFNELEGLEKTAAYKSSEIVRRFHQMTRPRFRVVDGKKIVESPLEPSYNDWVELEELVRQLYPFLHARISQPDLLTTQQFRVCMLMRLGFNTKDTATLLKTSPPRISKVKGLANERLFGHYEAESFVKNLKDL